MISPNARSRLIEIPEMRRIRRIHFIGIVSTVIGGLDNYLQKDNCRFLQKAQQTQGRNAQCIKWRSHC